MQSGNQQGVGGSESVRPYLDARPQEGPDRRTVSFVWHVALAVMSEHPEGLQHIHGLLTAFANLAELLGDAERHERLETLITSKQRLLEQEANADRRKHLRAQLTEHCAERDRIDARLAAHRVCLERALHDLATVPNTIRTDDKGQLPPWSYYWDVFAFGQHMLPFIETLRSTEVSFATKVRCVRAAIETQLCRGVFHALYVCHDGTIAVAKDAWPFLQRKLDEYRREYQISPRAGRASFIDPRSAERRFGRTRPRQRSGEDIRAELESPQSGTRMTPGVPRRERRKVVAG